MQQFQDIDKCSSFLNADVDNGISYDVRNRMPLPVFLDTGQSQHNILGPSTCYRGNMLRTEYLMMSHGSWYTLWYNFTKHTTVWYENRVLIFGTCEHVHPFSTTHTCTFRKVLKYSQLWALAKVVPKCAPVLTCVFPVKKFYSQKVNMKNRI
jgi:hypothetical protein